ncbi:MAG TPA: OmpH family outer membrane protein [Candidatus Dormibacteraeota bacterium]|nr:OmpH family outer membrane protein [Candidatus Dormibacteraeota bacterium]
MSKMHSPSSDDRRPRASTALVLALAAALAAAGCAPNVHSSAVRGTGYIRLDEVVKSHPLYPQLTQLDDAIAAINLQSVSPQVPRSAKEIVAQTAVLNRELRAAQERANKILAQKQRDYAGREQQAVASALAAAGIHGSGALAAQQMSGTSSQQAAQAAQAADADLMAYQQNVVAQDNAASSSIQQQLQTQAAQKYRAKAEQLQQNETDLSLRLTQQDAAARLAVKMRLSNLALEPDARKQAQAQLESLNAKESAAIDAQRNADAATLRAYRAQLDSQTGSAIRSQVGAIQAQTRVKLEERRNEVGSQLRSLGPPALPTNVPPNVQARITQIHHQFISQFQADAGKTVQEYNDTKSDLDRQFAALHGADVGATGAAAKELQSLQKRRADLYQQIVQQAERDATRIAKDRGFSIVFINIWAAAGGYDLTSQVIKDVESQHE